MSTTNVQPNFTGFKHWKRLTEENTTPQRLAWLWEMFQKCDYAFDDFARGQVDYFLGMFANPCVEFYGLADSGVVILQNPTEHGSCNIHYLTWDDQPSLAQRNGVSVEMFDYIFYERKIHRITGLIPIFNQKAIRFAVSIGMKYEGEMREDYLFHGKYVGVLIYGLLEKDYRERRSRLL